MLKVGITGGIGSGKSVVCQVFETLGMPVFYADTAAKYLMEHDRGLQQQIQSTFGEDVFTNGKLNTTALSTIIFSDADKRQVLNSLVHPATIRYGSEWMKRQTTPYVIKEAAILFESGSYKEMDIIIGVSAPYKMRLERAMQRDNTPAYKIEARMLAQMDEEEKMKRCHFVITNDGKQAIIPQVLQLHQTLLNLVASKSFNEE